MTITEAKDIVKRSLSESEILCQLAEEAAELAQSALKLRRAIDGTNPTPRSEKEAFQNMGEEVGDVMLCLDLLTLSPEYHKAFLDSSAKLLRWAKRLEARAGREDAKSSRRRHYE